jgi:hypothetical protein
MVPARRRICVSSALMRSLTVSLLVAAVLAAGPPAFAQTEDAAQGLPSTLFEPAPETLPGRPASDDANGAPMLLAAVLLAGAAVAGYFAGSSRRTRRS